MKLIYETAIFKSYTNTNGFYIFKLGNNEDIIFKEIHPQMLKKFNLKNDKRLINKRFCIKYTENSIGNQDDFIIYRIEYLVLMNSK
ncbi:hypothetical protein [uncultured Psychroserpens sp.]|uniref:hypothetical protein n=1 Tax=uncultured Psychroserpens sp. TaxID=255436 RepID=UPI002639A890|nr:hypothetical protein [uncultured Psychroserpens sp.]